MTLAREPRTSPIVPSYGESSLADLSASILASLTGDAAANVLGLPEIGRVCLLIVDGLGLELLRGHQAAAPFLAELAFNSRPLTAGFPSTTVTSLGVARHRARAGGARDARLPGRDPRHGPAAERPALAEGRRPGRLAAPADDLRAGGGAGVSAVHVAPGAYRNSGLTRATLRGADYRAANSLGALAALAVDALGESDRALVSAYHGTSTAAGTSTGSPHPPGSTSSRTWTGWRSRSPPALPTGRSCT